MQQIVASFNGLKVYVIFISLIFLISCKKDTPVDPISNPNLNRTAHEKTICTAGDRTDFFYRRM